MSATACSFPSSQAISNVLPFTVTATCAMAPPSGFQHGAQAADGGVEPRGDGAGLGLQCRLGRLGFAQFFGNLLAFRRQLRFPRADRPFETIDRKSTSMNARH